MSAADWAIVLTAFTGLVSAIFSGLAVLYSAWAKAAAETAVKDLASVSQKVEAVEKATNGMKDAQVDMASKLGEAVGEKKGRADKTAEIKQDKEDKKNEPPC